VSDPTILAKKIYPVPGNYQIKVDYQSGLNPIYVGYADAGVPTSSDDWFIQKITWDANSNPTAINVINDAVWDNRTTLNYR
jgi:hypothetical protein